MNFCPKTRCVMLFISHISWPHMLHKQNWSNHKFEWSIEKVAPSSGGNLRYKLWEQYNWSYWISHHQQQYLQKLSSAKASFFWGTLYILKNKYTLPNTKYTPPNRKIHTLKYQIHIPNIYAKYQIHNIKYQVYTHIPPKYQKKTSNIRSHMKQWYVSEEVKNVSDKRTRRFLEQ